MTKGAESRDLNLIIGNGRYVQTWSIIQIAIVIICTIVQVWCRGLERRSEPVISKHKISGSVCQATVCWPPGPEDRRRGYEDENLERELDSLAVQCWDRHWLQYSFYQLYYCLFNEIIYTLSTKGNITWYIIFKWWYYHILYSYTLMTNSINFSSLCLPRFLLGVSIWTSPCNKLLVKSTVE